MRTRNNVILFRLDDKEHAHSKKQVNLNQLTMLAHIHCSVSAADIKRIIHTGQSSRELNFKESSEQTLHYFLLELTRFIDKTIIKFKERIWIALGGLEASALQCAGLFCYI